MSPKDGMLTKHPQPAPFVKAFHEARHVTRETTKAIAALKAGIAATGDALVKKELTKALAAVKVAHKRATLVFADESLKNAPQLSAFGEGAADG